jgi:hypothetical protein
VNEAVMIEARRPGDMWEPISLSLSVPRVYHYATYADAKEALDHFLKAQYELPAVVVRLATGMPKISDVLEFRFVQIAAIQEVAA